MARLKEKYGAEVAPALMKQFEYKSVMQIPRIDKVVVNVGCGEARENAKVLENVVGDLAQITGQKPIITKARKSIANFKLREEMPIGAKVTLRGAKMWEFLDRLFNVALPRVRDFQGINPNSFDGRGNYALGIREQLISRRSSTIRSTRSAAWMWLSAPPQKPTRKPAPCWSRSALLLPSKEGREEWLRSL
jgi:large subunit ribosomal protein L5